MAQHDPDEHQAAAARSRLHGAESLLRDVIDSAPGAVFRLREAAPGEYRIDFMSEGLRAITGVDDSVDLTDFQTLAGWIPEPYRQAAIDSIRESRSRMSAYVEEFPFDVPRGRIWVQASSRPRAEPGGCVVWTGILTEITALKNARAEMDRLAAILESTPDCVAITDGDGRIEYMNAGGCRLLGIGEDRDLVGSSFLDFVHPDSARILTDAATQAARSERGWSGEISLLRRDGQAIPVSQTILAHRDANHSVLRFSTIIRDLRERVAAEQAIAASEARFRTLYNATPVMMHSIDVRGRLTAVNDHWLETLGYRRDEVLGRVTSEYFTAESRLQAETTDIPEFWRSGHQRDTPYRVYCRDGSVLDVLLSANVLHDSAGEMVGGLSVMTDISERRRLEADFRDIVENATEGIYRSSLDGRLLQVNPALARMHGFERQTELIEAVDSISRDWYMDPDSRKRLRALLEEHDRVEDFVAECRRVATGERFWTSENVRIARDARGNPRFLEGTVRDISVDIHARELGRARGEILEMIARDHPLTDILYEIIGALEQHFQRLTAAIFRLSDGRLEAAAVPALSAQCIAALNDRAPSEIGGAVVDAMHAVRAVCGRRDSMESDSLLAAAMGDSGYDAIVAVPIRDQRNAVLGFLTAFAANADDVSPRVGEVLGEMAQMTSIAFEQARLAEELVRQARYDPLTELPNRSLLNERLQQAIAEAERSGSAVAVLLLDLDEFKLINDTLGHGAGDELLHAVAQRLHQQTRAGDTVARLGGDEFVLVASVSGPAGAVDVAERLLATLQAHFVIDDQEITARPSIGISLYPGDGDRPEVLLEGADTAMYAAKTSGKNQYRFFAGAMNERVTERLRIETGLRSALDEQILTLHYQPRINLEDRRTLGAEALLRWPQDDGTFLLPGSFLSIAERSSLIGEIDLYVLERALRQLSSWQKAGHRLVLSTNLSAGELHADGFGADVARMLEIHGVDPAGFELEITESMLMQDFEYATGQLRDLKERAPGVRIAIDDFGSGYSSLSYLRHLPIDTLKIDGSFVADLDSADVTQPAAAIVRTIVEMGRNLHFNVVAEGVEKIQQATLLRELGCHEAQGILIAPALDETDLRAWLA